MKSKNRVDLIGYVGQDPEVKTFESGNKIATFSMATTYYRKDGDERVETTTWHDIEAWKYSADIAEKYIQKGTAVNVEGYIKVDEWEDKDGNKRYRTKIVATDINVLNGGKPVTANEPKEEKEVNGNVEEKEDDLPF